MKFLKKSTKIKFSVDGKPPKKTKPSMWSESEDNKQVESVFMLRQKAYEEMNKAKLNRFHGPVKLTLIVYDPNPDTRKDRPDYLGDLDALIGGVFDALQPVPPEENNLKIHPRLMESNHYVISDDAQIATTVASKRKNEKTYYTVKIELD